MSQGSGIRDQESEERDLRVALCVVSDGTWYSATATCVADLVQAFTASRYAGGRKALDVVSVTGAIVPELRQRCVAEAWAREASHLLWIGPDMTFPADALHRLLGHGLPVVAANYVRAELPSSLPTAYVDGDDYVGPLVTSSESGGLVEVAHAGLGLMLCDMQVFEAIELPFFEYLPQPPNNLRFVGEDVAFCRKLKAAGIPLLVDQALSRQVGHLGRVEFTHGLGEVAKRKLLRSFKDQGSGIRDQSRSLIPDT